MNFPDTNNMNKYIRDFYFRIEFKKGYKPLSNLLKNEGGDLHANMQNNMNK